MGKYDDIIDMPYKKSTRHAHMSTHDRAAQFAPFAALTGYGEAVEETARFTDSKIELAEVKLDYFVQDKLKQGGKYISYKGTVDKIDEHEKKLRLSKGTWIRIEDIFDIKLV